ncbi:MAG: hypothetical protein GTO45_15220 [Candidatus Aminicenantes bacterium]|nr:hypothetical protein [Candidatus Aminicenantes bacterium]NIM80119.1 hypothetical protein [Candidatus Aminicenantes bacterium]NIN19457.1 hypothetical protein [Candidatus Aminicenantes bacterium]NIN43356.1 hypothetical protein [Candidatus Aminicenantes bacterium]NIN86101.1 hypothetical protein [Candidatus Aminicenantes bacterium]
METVEASSQSTAAASRKKMDALISIGAEKVVDNALNKVISYQLAKYRKFIDQINHELETFEMNYKMSSEEFYNKFEAGELGDEGDFFEWSSLYENVLLYKDRIKELNPLVTE